VAGFHKQLVAAEVMQKVVDAHMEQVAVVMQPVGVENCSGQLVVAENYSELEVVENYNEQVVMVAVENGTLVEEVVVKVMEVVSKQ
jgi:hypothetical protein